MEKSYVKCFFLQKDYIRLSNIYVGGGNERQQTLVIIIHQEKLNQENLNKIEKINQPKEKEKKKKTKKQKLT